MCSSFFLGGGNLLEYCNTQKSTRAAFFLTIIFSVASLVYFKYCDFILDNLNRINFRLADKDIVRRHSIVAPIGISFFSFQALGYVIDVYHKKIRAEKNLFRYAAFVSFFPTITSGPINRSDNLLAQMQRKEGKFISCESLYSGFMLALYGAFLKMVIAGRLSVLTDTVFNNYKSYGGFILFFASVCYTFQIYCDFSSYSLIAIGISRMLGYEVVENFKAPYFSENIQEFWRRWHISLSTWFREYVYIPLGGNRCGGQRNMVNLILVWALTGLWHGAEWNFLFWGLYYGVLLILEKHVWGALMDRLPGVIQHIYTFVLVMVGWVFFFSPDLGSALDHIGMMFGMGASALADRQAVFLLTTHWLLFLLCILGSSSLGWKILCAFMESYKKGRTQRIMSCVIYMGIFLVSVAFLVTETFNPFLYFRF